MKGLLIKYIPKDKNARVLLNHTIFGRVLYKNYRGRKYAYYVQGELDDRRWLRPRLGSVFVVEYEDILDELKDWLRIFGDATFDIVNMDIKEEDLHTGEEYWRNIVSKKQLPFKKRIRRGRR